MTQKNSPIYTKSYMDKFHSLGKCDERRVYSLGKCDERHVYSLGKCDFSFF